MIKSLGLTPIPINISTKSKIFRSKIPFHLDFEDRQRDYLKFLKDNNILAMIHYKQAVHMQNAYKREGELPITERIVGNILSLPMYPELDRKTVSYICKKLKDFDIKDAK